MKQFGLISLCNVSYKTVTKILSARLRRVMKELIDPCQCSFIPNRQSSDNTIIAQEVIHSMKNKKGQQSWMAIKIDLEKAYDKIKWCFVIDTLKDIGFSDIFVNLVRFCISTPSFSGALEWWSPWNVSPSRGIRQGDFISPYLFVLCIERLFHLINYEVEQGLWKPIQLSRSGPKISHLSFAYDLLLFAEASLD